MMNILLILCILAGWDIGIYRGFPISSLRLETHPNAFITTRYMTWSLALTRWVKKDRAITIFYERVWLKYWPNKTTYFGENTGVAFWYGYFKKGFLFGPSVFIYYDDFGPYFKFSSLWFIYGIDLRITGPDLIRFKWFGLTPMVSVGYIPRVNYMAIDENGFQVVRPERFDLITFDFNMMFLLRF